MWPRRCSRAAPRRRLDPHVGLPRPRRDRLDDLRQLSLDLLHGLGQRDAFENDPQTAVSAVVEMNAEHYADLVQEPCRPVPNPPRFVVRQVRAIRDEVGVNLDLLSTQDLHDGIHLPLRTNSLLAAAPPPGGGFGGPEVEHKPHNGSPSVRCRGTTIDEP